MASVTTPRATSAPARALRLVERERLVIAVPAIFGANMLLRLPQQLGPDGWLALVSGRSVAQHGLPDADTLTVYTGGEQWIDQQWLGQLAFFRLHELGGMRLLAIVSVVLAIATLALALAAARRAGATPVAVTLVALPALAALGPVLSIRTQVFGLVLFPAVLWLLIEDARRPSPRVLWVLPLLAVWANVHGSVLLAAGLVVLRGACAVREGRARHGLLLAAGAVAALFATPYALQMPHYYATTALNPQFTALVTEWHRTAPSLVTAPFYLLLFAATWLLARHARSVTTFEKLALLATGVLGLLAIRNTAWFALAALMILPVALTRGMRATPDMTARRVALPIAYGPLLCFAVVLAVTAARPSAWFERTYPAGPADVVARVAATDRSARVFADLRYADWLMWKHPALEGRVAFDARLELLTREQLTGMARFLSQTTDGWRAAAAGYRVLVLDRGGHPAVVVRRRP